jgi:hypothetical protein
MFKETALHWIADLEEAGRIGDLDGAARGKLADDYAAKLEAYFNEAVANQLKPLGKDQEFERMLLYDSQYTHKYLNQTIPGYYGFRAEVFEKAREKIVGE